MVSFSWFFLLNKNLAALLEAALEAEEGKAGTRPLLALPALAEKKIRRSWPQPPKEKGGDHLHHILGYTYKVCHEGQDQEVVDRDGGGAPQLAGYRRCGKGQR